MPLKIRGSSHDNTTTFRDTARGHVRIRQRPHSQRNVDALADEIQATVVEDELNVKVGVFGVSGIVGAHVIAFALLIGIIALPGAFLAHFVLTRGAHAVRELLAKRWAFPNAFLAMALISPLVFYMG